MHRVQHLMVKGNVAAFGLATQEGHIKGRVVRDDHGIAGPAKQPFEEPALAGAGDGPVRRHAPALCAAIWDYRQNRGQDQLRDVAEEVLRRAPFDPDILCLGKALTGGHVTLAVTIATEAVARGIGESEAGVLMHGPTYMANPLACSAAVASLEQLSVRDWRAEVNAIADQMKQRLTNLFD